LSSALLKFVHSTGLHRIDKAGWFHLECVSYAYFGRLHSSNVSLQIFASAFLAILFLQSGIDKIVDRRGNFEWLKAHFAKTPLTGIASPNCPSTKKSG
jgi:hypothetical protein